jgi:hypothetical protein
VAKARQAICERGQKLSEVEDRTEMMANEAKVTDIFIQLPHSLTVSHRREFDQLNPPLAFLRDKNEFNTELKKNLIKKLSL